MTSKEVKDEAASRARLADDQDKSSSLDEEDEEEEEEDGKARMQQPRRTITRSLDEASSSSSENDEPALSPARSRGQAQAALPSTAAKAATTTTTTNTKKRKKPTEEEVQRKMERRRAVQRENSQRLRDRQKLNIDQLKSEKDRIRSENVALATERELLQRGLREAQSENLHYRSLLGHNGSMMMTFPQPPQPHPALLDQLRRTTSVAGAAGYNNDQQLASATMQQLEDLRRQQVLTQLQHSFLQPENPMIPPFGGGGSMSAVGETLLGRLSATQRSSLLQGGAASLLRSPIEAAAAAAAGNTVSLSSASSMSTRLNDEHTVHPHFLHLAQHSAQVERHISDLQSSIQEEKEPPAVDPQQSQASSVKQKGGKGSDKGKAAGKRPRKGKK